MPLTFLKFPLFDRYHSPSTYYGIYYDTLLCPHTASCAVYLPPVYQYFTPNWLHSFKVFLLSSQNLYHSNEVESDAC